MQSTLRFNTFIYFIIVYSIIAYYLAYLNIFITSPTCIRQIFSTSYSCLSLALWVFQVSKVFLHLFIIPFIYQLISCLNCAIFCLILNKISLVCKVKLQIRFTLSIDLFLFLNLLQLINRHFFFKLIFNIWDVSISRLIAFARFWLSISYCILIITNIISLTYTYFCL